MSARKTKDMLRRKGDFLKGRGRLIIILLICILQAVCAMHVFASGSAETDAATVNPRNSEWILCITNIDVSALPPNRVNISDLVSRKMVERLSSINYRARILPEYVFYEENAWAHDHFAAARALAAKMEERSQILFRGDPEWRYRRNIVKLDAEIEKLRAALEETENNPPLIEREPVFKLTQGNIDLSFPAAPQTGGEIRFCSAQKADGFLISSIVNFHGRYILNVKLFTLYTRSFVWQDSIIFSNDDLEIAIEEITRKMIIVLSGSDPAAVSINAEPSDTLILINRSFAGRGETDVLEYPPGTIFVTASAPNHESLTFETDLSPGVFSKINIRLNPIEYIDIDIRGDADGRVYQGALYVGEAPLTLRLPLQNLEYIEMETSDSRRGTIVFQTPQASDNPQTLSLTTAVPVERGRVDRLRRHYYWSWGGVWISGMTAWISYYTLGSYASVAQSGKYTDEFANNYAIMNNVFNGSLIALGVTGAYCVYRLIRYLYTANRGSTRIVVPSARTAQLRNGDPEVIEFIEGFEESEEQEEME